MRRLTVLLAVLSISGRARAQQAIISMPSADVTPKGELFVMHETQLRPRELAAFIASFEFTRTTIGSSFSVTRSRPTVPTSAKTRWR